MYVRLQASLSFRRGIEVRLKVSPTKAFAHSQFAHFIRNFADSKIIIAIHEIWDGDKVLMLHSNEEGEVVEIINNKMVMVDVRGVKFPHI